MPTITREEFSAKAREIASEHANDLHEMMMKAFDALTDKEVDKLDTPGKPWLLIRAIGMVVGPITIDKRFNAEAIKGMIPRIKRILNRRTW